jgi:hypothetical protein
MQLCNFRRGVGEARACLDTLVRSDVYKYGTFPSVETGSHIFHQNPPMLVVCYCIFCIWDLYKRQSAANILAMR